MADMSGLSNLPPEELAKILAVTPAGIPPKGVLPNLVDPPTVGYYVVAANSVLMVIMLAFVAIRFYVALKIRGRFSPDDWTTVVAVTGSCYYFICVILAIRINKFGTHMWNLSALHMKTRNMAVLSYLTNGPTHLIWPWVKTTFFLMYLQLFRPLTWLRNCVYAGLAIIWSWYLANAITQMVLTAPLPGQSWEEAFAGPRYLKTFKLCIPSAAVSLVSDVFLLVLPLVAISHLRLSFAKKVGVGAMFSTGFICCLASSVSVYWNYRIVDNQNDYTFYVAFVYLCYTIEMCVGIATSCMPSLARLNKIKGERKASSNGSHLQSLRKVPNDSSGTRSSAIEGYPKKSSYAYMEESNHSLHEMGRVQADSSIRNNQHSFSRPSPNDRIQCTIDISQTRTALSSKGPNVESWQGTRP